MNNLILFLLRNAILVLSAIAGILVNDAILYDTSIRPSIIVIIMDACVFVMYERYIKSF